MWTPNNSTNIDWPSYEFDGWCPDCDFCNGCGHAHRVGENHRCARRASGFPSLAEIAAEASKGTNVIVQAIIARMLERPINLSPSALFDEAQAATERGEPAPNLLGPPDQPERLEDLPWLDTPMRLLPPTVGELMKVHVQGEFPAVPELDERDHRRVEQGLIPRAMQRVWDEVRRAYTPHRRG